MYFKFLVGFLLCCSLEVFSQAPVRSLRDNEQEYRLVSSVYDNPFSQGSRHRSSPFERNGKPKGKVLIISGVSLAALGIWGFAYASGNNLRDKYLLEGVPIIEAFSGADAALAIVSLSAIFNGVHMTGWGTVKYLKTK